MSLDYAKKGDMKVDGIVFATEDNRRFRGITRPSSLALKMRRISRILRKHLWQCQISTKVGGFPIGGKVAATDLETGIIRFQVD